MPCAFCGHRGDAGADTPSGRVCETCAARIGALARLGGEVARICWGVVHVPGAKEALARLVEDEMSVLDLSAAFATRRLEAATAHLEQGRAADSVAELGTALASWPRAPVADRALALLLGPMLKPGGAEALRAALFRA